MLVCTRARARPLHFSFTPSLGVCTDRATCRVDTKMAKLSSLPSLGTVWNHACSLLAQTMSHSCPRQSLPSSQERVQLTGSEHLAQREDLGAWRANPFNEEPYDLCPGPQAGSSSSTWKRRQQLDASHPNHPERILK